MQEFHDRSVRSTSISVHCVLDALEDLNLDGMAYAEGAGLDTTKQCLDGTRVEILKEIVDWTTPTLMCHGSSGFTARPAGENPPSLTPSHCST